MAIKRTIASAAQAVPRPCSAVWSDLGTTILQPAKRLRVTSMPLTLMTNTLASAGILFGLEPEQVFKPGGRLGHGTQCMAAPLTGQAIQIPGLRPTPRMSLPSRLVPR